MSVRPVLRLGAIAIAVAGIVDPTMTRERPGRDPLTVVALNERVLPSAQEFARRIDGGNVTVRVHQAARAAACPSAGGCVLVSDGTVPERLTSGASVIGALRVPAATPRLRIVEAPLRVHLDAASVLRVGMHRPAERVEVFDEGVLVGFAAAAQGPEVEVTWTPVAAGPRQLRVVADDDSADVGVLVDTKPAAVLLFEPEASWSGTFVRRALEDDGRFDVKARAEIASSVAVSRGGAVRLDASALAKADVVIVTATHALRTAQVLLLEQFVTRRGGSVVLVLDQRPTGPVLRLAPAVASEHREAQPQRVGQLNASWLLAFEEATDVAVLERSGDRAVVVSKALGRGRIIAVGALDAWRHRDAGRAFEAYWTGLTWDAASAAGPPLRITAAPLAEPGTDVPLEFALQSMADLPAEISAEGRFDCARERGALQLLPTPTPGRFGAVFRPSLEGTCRIAASIEGVGGVTDLLVTSDVRRPDEDDERLNAAMAAHGAVIAVPGRENDLLVRIDERRPPIREATVSRPMRSALWILPFAGCLALEWLLRRRSGLL